MSARPKWLELGEVLLWDSIGVVLTETRDLHFSQEYIDPIPHLAACHLANCIELSIDANKEGKHSVAVCLVRHCIEAMTIIELGYLERRFSEPLLVAWFQSKKSHGELRQALEEGAWPQYGTGLWDEPWADFIGNLARAVQPYAHYTPELQGWQLATIKTDYTSRKSIVAIGPRTYDPIKASRITLLHVLIGWTLARILTSSHLSDGLESRSAEITQLGRAIASSQLLFKGGDWGTQLVPHMMFKPGRDWRDP